MAAPVLAAPPAAPRRRRSRWRWLLLPFHLLERARGRWRLLVGFLYLLVATVLGGLLWREASLRADLPDVGEPFDARAFLDSCRVPPERDAAPLYRRAAELIKAGPGGQADWSLAGQDTFIYGRQSAAVRAAVDRAGPALACWIEATRRPDALLVPPETLHPTRALDPVFDLRQLSRFGLLEASRRREAGDLEGAWECLAAVVRCSRHAGRHGSVVARLLGRAILGAAGDPIRAWAADPRTRPELMRRALADLAAAEALTPPASEMLRAEYLACRGGLADPKLIRELHETRRTRKAETWMFLPGALEAEWFARHEPERSRRVMALVFANWLAQCDRPPARRAPAAAGPSELNLFDATLDRTAPPAARVAPTTIEAGYRTALVAPEILPALAAALGAGSDVRTIRLLRLELAERLYERERGRRSPRPRALVEAGYLDRLPDGYEEIAD